MRNTEMVERCSDACVTYLVISLEGQNIPVPEIYSPLRARTWAPFGHRVPSASATSELTP